ncbi:MAG: glycoside hydrolase family 2 protein, partial [Oscillospiraceae bacterium]
MKTEFLNKNWKMRQCGDENWQVAVVPGTVYTDLLRNGNMENPFWRDNEQKAFDIMQNDFEYETSFNAEIPDENADVILLHFDGLDTITEVFLNNQKLGDTENMHRVWEFDVTHLLKNGENTLRVYFHSPIKYAAEQFAISKTYGDEDAIDGFVNIRKAHCMYGWDWGAHLPDAGIFRPVSLVYVEKARFDDVYITQKHSQNNVLLTLNVETENVSILPKDEVKYTVVVVDPNGIKKEFDNSPCEINIENPMLWWANGLGKQYLYGIVITLFVNGKKVDEWSKKIGLRTLTVSIKKDEWGESFAHELNGIPIFAMGADYIPEDHLLGRVNPQITRTLLEKAVFANFNTIRVWGGGYYPDDWFYEQCDEMGLIVWQDFM